MIQAKSAQRQLFQLIVGSLLMLLLFTLSGCSTISEHDAKTLSDTHKISEKITTLLISLEELNKQAPDCLYENFKDDYKAIKVGLNTLSLREKAKLQNADTIKMVGNLNSSIGKLIDLHRSGCLSTGEATLLQKQFNSLIGSILTLENAKPQPLF